MASKKKSSKPQMTKREFIESLPKTMGRVEIVAEAKKQMGWKLDADYVSRVRPTKGGAKKSGAAKGATSTSVAANKPRPSGGSGDDLVIAFLEMAKKLGKERAKRLVELL